MNQVEIEGTPVPLVVPPTAVPPPLSAMVPIVKSVAGIPAATAKSSASEVASGGEAVAVTAAYTQAITAMAGIAAAILVPKALGGDAVAAQILIEVGKTVAAAELNETQVQATAAQL